MKKTLKLEWLRKLLGLPSDEEIASLRKLVAEKLAQENSLTKQLEEKQAQETSLTKLLAERDEEIKSLNEDKAKAEQEKAEYEARKQAAFEIINNKLGEEKELEKKAVGRPGKFRTNDKIELTPYNSNLLKMLFHNHALGGKSKVGFVNDHIESLLHDLLSEHPEYKDIYDQALEETLIEEAEWKKQQEEKKRLQAEERAQKKALEQEQAQKQAQEQESEDELPLVVEEPVE